MKEFEPKKKIKIVDKEFLAKYSYVLVLALLLVGGISYGYTFFIQNSKIASGSLTTANLTINFSDRNINANGLSVPLSDQEGLNEFSKSLTITNGTTIDGKVKLSLTRTSGLALTDLRYAIIINGAIQEIGDVPANGKILSSAIMGNQTLNTEVRLWPKTTYTGSETTFVGEITPEISYLGGVATDANNLTGKYVNFNCSSTCEVWQIVKIENDRLVLTRQADYSGATSRTNSNRYNPNLTFNDNSLITSVSTDNKNVYLAKTTKVTSGNGTIDSPYTLSNNVFHEEDKKVIAVITYKENTTTLGTQNIYYNETNYISQVMDDPDFTSWSDGTNNYVLGDTINFTTDTNLEAVIVRIYYNVLKRNAVMDNVRSTYVNSDSGINFVSISSDNNGKGLYMRAGTENDDYPILYYRGDVNNNNVLFGGFCWKIVRTTDTGGIKMIYNGIAENDQCLTNRTTPSGVKTGASRSNQTLNDTNGTYNYYYGTNYTYDTTTNQFTLAGTVSNSKQWNATNYPDLIGKYTCKATTPDASCTPLYFIDEYQSNTNASTTQLTVASTGSYTHLGLSAFNSKPSSPAYGGYMYGKSYNQTTLNLTTSQKFTSQTTLLGSASSFSTSYYYATSYDWNTTNPNKYTLTSSTQVASEMDFSTLVNHYVMNGTNNTVMYYIFKYADGKMYYITFNDSGTHDLTYFNNSYTYGDTLTDNGNGTYTISNSDSSNTTTITKTTYYDNYANLVGKYVCKDATNDICSTPYYVTSTTETSITYISAINTNTITLSKTRNGLELTGTPLVIRRDLLVKNQSDYGDYKYTCNNNDTTCTAANLRYITGFTTTGYSYAKNYYFGTSVTKPSTNYVLQNTIGLENYNNLTNLATHHYTCITAGLTECDKVAYIYYYTGSGSADYILLENDTMSVDAAINEMQTNTKDSTIKAVIDNWFRVNLTNEINSNITNYQTYLEDTIYCNDRRMNTLGTDQEYINNGWIANGGGMNNYLYYLGHGRSYQTYTPNLSCLKNDAFTVNETVSGNGALTYPVGLLTNDEVMLAGGVADNNNSSYYLRADMVYQYWLSGSYNFQGYVYEFRVSSDGALQYSFVHSPGGVRPTVSLKPGTMLGVGTGEPGSPLEIVE